MKRPTALILLGTRHRPEDARRCVESVLAHTTDVDWWLYVADARDLGGPRFVYDHERVRVYEERPRRGMSAGLNRLVARAAVDLGVALPEWVVWLNDDATVEPGWLGTGIAQMEACPGAGMGALPYLTPHPPEGWHVNYFPTPDLPYANFGLLRTKLWRTLGGFDERVVFYGCDNAFTFRVLGAGYGILPLRGARIVHHYAEDPVREQNVRWDLRKGWDEAKAEYLVRLGDYRVTQRKTVGVPKGFTLRADAWIEPDPETYVARYRRVAGANTADVITAPTQA